MDTGSDIIVYDQHDRLALAVEAKTKLNASTQWASRLRHNILAHDVLPQTKFFLIATPDQFFIWKNEEENLRVDAEIDLTENEPTHIIDSQPFLAPYFDRIGVTPENIRGSSFELMITAWLSELMCSGRPPELIDDNYQKLIDLGLQDAVLEGNLGPKVFV